MTIKTSLLVGAAVGAIFGTAQASEAETADIEVNDRIYVYGRNLSLAGEAESASEGIVGFADFEDRPLSRVGELVEVVPGMVATQHSGEGKANQYFFRGFNLDHGTDFSISVDGLPVNMRSHGHGQGYLDINFIIPETVETVAYRKGPYYADRGDFSAAGSAAFSTVDVVEDNFAEIAIGEYDYFRAVSVGSIEISPDTSLLLAGEYQGYDGPWELSSDIDKVNLLAKVTRDTANGRYFVKAEFYDNDWRSTDQVPERAIDSGLIDRFGFIDDDLGGSTTRSAITVGGSVEQEAGQTDFSAYALSYDFELTSNPTYFLNDPVNGDEFVQRDDRNVYGASIDHGRELTERLRLSAGAEIRYDDIDKVGVFPSVDGVLVGTVSDAAVEQLGIGVYAELEADLTERLRARVGVRGDYIDAEVEDNFVDANSGSAHDTLFSPSVALAYSVSDQIELYANYGRGFHTNDVRGATVTVDPVTSAPLGSAPIFVQAEGAELGARFERGDLKATVAAYWMALDSELLFVGDGGTTEPSDGSERYGIEVAGFWKPTDWLALDGSYAYVDATFDVPGPDDQIPNAHESVYALGATARFEDLTLSARLRGLGNAPLVEDGSVEWDGEALLNLAATYDYGPATFGLELLNALDEDASDIEYLFESQLAGEAAPVEDIHLHPAEPRMVRASLRVRF